MDSGFSYLDDEKLPLLHTINLKKLKPSEFNRGLKQSMLFLMPKEYNGNLL